MNEISARETQRVAKPWVYLWFRWKVAGKKKTAFQGIVGRFCTMRLIMVKECGGQLEGVRQSRTPSRTRLDSRMGNLKDQTASEQTHHAISSLPKGERHAECWTPKGREGASGVSRRGDLVQISVVENDPTRCRVSARDDGIIRKQQKYPFSGRGGGTGLGSSLPEGEMAEARVEDRDRGVFVLAGIRGKRAPCREPLALRSCMENGETALGYNRRRRLSV